MRFSYKNTLCILIYMFFLFIASCDSAKKKEIQRDRKADSVSNVQENNMLQTDTLRWPYTKISDELNLDKLAKSVKNMEIRVWFEYASSDSGRVLIIKNNIIGLWTVKAYYYKFYYDKKGEFDSLGYKSEQVHPSKNWCNFVESSYQSALSRLVDYTQIANYELCFDGDALIVEVAGYEKYTVTGYPCYEVYREVEDVKNIKKILSETQEQLGLRLFPRPAVRHMLRVSK